LEALEQDPGKRIPISRFVVNDHDRVRRRFIELGPVWFKEHKLLEYSVEKYIINLFQPGDRRVIF
jgi:hypothetical protein